MFKSLNNILLYTVFVINNNLLTYLPKGFFFSVAGTTNYLLCASKPGVGLGAEPPKNVYIIKYLTVIYAILFWKVSLLIMTEVEQVISGKTD